MLIAPSMLACDFAHMGRELEKITEAGCDLVHLDVMDGNFVPNISFGAPVIKCIRPISEKPFDVHLMVDHPKQYVPDFLDAGADIISFHFEARDNVSETIDAILAGGAKAALAIKPNTRPEAVFPYLDRLYMVLVMTVEPGFGGQSFMHDMMDKVRTIKAKAPSVLIEVDGGINPETAKISAEAGVDICVAGTTVFHAQDPKAIIKELQAAGR